ncbi:hypothetical protein F5B18DRAFT_620100 [Nemania serpens]|nr:hypothetical protein F5B18DRAFT_620100 [Nemania serpens]
MCKYLLNLLGATYLSTSYCCTLLCHSVVSGVEIQVRCFPDRRERAQEGRMMGVLLSRAGQNVGSSRIPQRRPLIDNPPSC